MKVLFILSFIFIFSACENRQEPSSSSDILLQIGDTTWDTYRLSQRLVFAAKDLSPVELNDGQSVKKIKDQLVQNLLVEALLIQWDQQSKSPISQEAIQKNLSALQEGYQHKRELFGTNKLSHVDVSSLLSQVHARLAKEKLLKTFKTYNDVEKQLSEIQKKYWADKKSYMAPAKIELQQIVCLLYTSPSPRDRTRSRMPSSA